MKNLQICSRETGLKIVLAAGLLGLASSIGAILLPSPAPDFDASILGGVLTGTLLVLVWGIFNLVRPSRYSRQWAMATTDGAT